MNDFSITQSLDEKKSLLEQWIHRWGCAVSETVLDSECFIFRTAGIDGFIGYRIKSSCAVVHGDPICPIEEMPRLAEAFHRYCQEKNLNIVYIITSKQFGNWAIQHLCSIMIQVGEELIFDPQKDPTEGSAGHRLRNKMNHVLHLGFKAHEYLSYDAKLEQSIQEAGAAWLKARKGPQIYLGPLNFFENRADKRWFYVAKGEQIIAAALLSRLKARQGWLLKFLITVPGSPRGTSEFLMISILEALRKENCHFLTYGIVPSDHLGEVIGVSKPYAWFGQAMFKLAKWLFKLNHRKMYWEKFNPKSEPAYILFSQPDVGLKEVQAIVQALKIEFK